MTDNAPSKMSDEELSRWISEKWEPQASLDIRSKDNLRLDGINWESPKRAWRLVLDWAQWVWQPRDWTQPEGSMMLFGALIDKLGMKRAFEELEIALSDYPETNHLYSHHLPRAIMDTYYEVEHV